METTELCEQKDFKMNHKTLIIVVVGSIAASGSAMGQSAALEAVLERRVRGPAQVSAPAPAAPAVDRVLANEAVRRAPAPGNALDRARSVLDDARPRGAAIGNLAEQQFLRDNPNWRLVSNPIAPQNDVYRWVNGQLEGGQIKTHHPGRTGQYARDMLKDNRAERFFIPDDHVDAVRRDIERHIEREQQRAARQRQLGNHARAARHEGKVGTWQRNLNRVAPMGRTYAELESAVTRAAKGFCRRAAGGTGLLGGGAVIILDGGIVLYRAANGELTPQERQSSLVGTGIKAGAVGTAVGCAVLLGANPIGLPVIVIGGVAYFIADYGVSQMQEHSRSTPMTADQIRQLLPRNEAHPVFR
jgi:hypothetical protein